MTSDRDSTRPEDFRWEDPFRFAQRLFALGPRRIVGPSPYGEPRTPSTGRPFGLRFAVDDDA